LFWLDRCVGDVPLRDRYRRLFDLSENKLLTVAQMHDFGWGEVVRHGSEIVGLGGVSKGV